MPVIADACALRGALERIHADWRPGRDNYDSLLELIAAPEQTGGDAPRSLPDALRPRELSGTGTTAPRPRTSPRIVTLAGLLLLACAAIWWQL